MSRRELLRGGLLRPIQRAAGQAAASPSVEGDKLAPHQSPAQRHQRPFPVIRPPGAVDEGEFLADCTRCDACAQACPHDAIAHAPVRFRHAAGTPMIDPARQPCLMCDDLPCVGACEPGVLRMDLPRRIATASLLTYNCVAWEGGICSACSEHCPEPGALTMTDGKPHIHEDVCTGCGACHYVCPAPTNAIAMMPLQSRPGAKGEP